MDDVNFLRNVEILTTVFDVMFNKLSNIDFTAIVRKNIVYSCDTQCHLIFIRVMA